MATGVKMKDACHIACAELMNCLIRELGVVDTEYFIAAVQRERFDYTKWQREHFDKMDLQNFVDKASAYAKEKGK